MRKHSLFALSLVAILSACAPKAPKKAPTQTDLPSGGTTIKESDEANYRAAVKNTLEGMFTLADVTALRYDLSVSVKASGLNQQTELGLMTAAEAKADVDLSVKSLKDEYKTFGLEFKNMNFVATLDGKKTNVLTNLTVSLYLVESEEKCMAYLDLSNSSFASNLRQVAQLLMGENYDPALFSDTALRLLIGKERRGYFDATSKIEELGLGISPNAPVSETLIPLFTVLILPSILSEIDEATDKVVAMHPTVKKWSDKSYGFAINSTIAKLNEAVGAKDDGSSTGELGLSVKSGKSNGSKNAALEQVELKADITEVETSQKTEVRAKLTGTYDSAIKSNPAASFNANSYPNDYSGLYDKIMNIINLVKMVA